MSNDIIVCRCEDITLGQLREKIEQGYTSLDELRRIIRCGMGECQGRNCRPLVVNELARALNIPPDQVTLNTWRPPLKPVKLGALAEAESDEGGSCCGSD